jgi:hypothetical protein
MARKAKGRSLGDFRLFLGGRQFYPAELKLLEACAEGKFPSIPSARPTKQTLHNFVRTDFLRFLMLGGDENAPIHEQGVQLRGAWIDGELLDLEGALLPHDVALNHCRINCKIALIAARTRRIDLDGSQISELSGDGIKIKGDLFLRKDFTAQGAVKLTGAKIDGDLDCRGGTFKNASTSALSFDRAEINGNVFLNNGFVAEGDVHLVGAKIAGDLDCNGGIFRKTTDAALDFSRAEIGGDVFLRNKFDANGMVRSKDAKIGGNLDCSNGSFKNPNGHALFFESAKIGGAVLLGYGFSADGEVNLSNAKIGCHFDCRDGTFNDEKLAHCAPNAPDVSILYKPDGSREEKQKVGNWWWCKDLPGEYTSFSPFTYSLDLILPVVSLGQEKDWRPITPSADKRNGTLPIVDSIIKDALDMFNLPILFPDGRILDKNGLSEWREHMGLWVRFVTWFENLFGWVASLIMVATLSGLVKKDDA